MNPTNQKPEDEIYNARTERLSLLIGTVVGQISELLNNMCANPAMYNLQIYKSLFDIHQAAGLQIHELFYKRNKPFDAAFYTSNKP